MKYINTNSPNSSLFNSPSPQLFQEKFLEITENRSEIGAWGVTFDGVDLTYSPSGSDFDRVFTCIEDQDRLTVAKEIMSVWSDSDAPWPTVEAYLSQFK